MPLNKRIKKLRKTLDLTQREFGDRIGVKPNTIPGGATEIDGPYCYRKVA